MNVRTNARPAPPRPPRGVASLRSILFRRRGGSRTGFDNPGYLSGRPHWDRRRLRRPRRYSRPSHALRWLRPTWARAPGSPSWRPPSCSSSRSSPSSSASCSTPSGWSGACSPVSARRRSPSSGARSCSASDGLDPAIARRLMKQGRLPHMQRLADKGTFKPLGTTTPAMSPVAWELVRHGRRPVQARRLRLPDPGSAQLPAGAVLGRGRPAPALLRRGALPDPAGQARAAPAAQEQVLLVAPGQVPDPGQRAACADHLPAREVRREHALGHVRTRHARNAGLVHLLHDAPRRREARRRSPGSRSASTATSSTRRSKVPPTPLRKDGRLVTLPVTLKLDRAKGQAELRVSGKRFPLKPGDYTDWVQLAFPMGLGFKVKGIARFRLTELGDEHVGLYVTPMNIDPASPALPISHPFLFSVFLAKLNGAFATLGLAEDTWALKRRRARRRRLPPAGLGHPRRARADVLPDAAPHAQGAHRLRLRRLGPRAAYVHALRGRGPPRPARPRRGIEGENRRHRRALRAHGPARGPDARRSGHRRPVEPGRRHVRPRLQELPAAA